MEREIYKTIADYMIAEGCEQTSSGNWIFYHDEINTIFGVDLPNDKKLINDIAKYITEQKRDIVADLDLSQGFDLNFYTAYCPNLDEFCLEGMDTEAERYSSTMGLRG